MKRIIFLFLPFLPYLASAQVAKDTVTVLTLAQIPAGEIRDTTNITFVQDNAFAKANFDSLAKYTRVKLQTYTLDSTHITASGLNLQGTRFTGVLPVTRGGTGNTTGLAATATALATARTIQTNLASTSAASFNGTANITPGVTGQLPVGNGGTGTGTQFTEGRVVFAGAGGVYSQDANLTYNSITGVRQLKVENPTTTGVPVFYAKARIGGISGDDPAGAAVFEIDGGAGSGLWAISQYYISSGDVTDDISFTFLGKDAGGSARTVVVLGADITSLADGAPVADFVIWNANGGNPSELYRFQADGDFGIGTANPSQKLHVVGNARITAMNGINDIGADANGVLQAATSDYNLKNSIQDSDFGLNHILRLKPVTFLYNDQDRKIHSEIPEIGFIAQDVNDVIPNAVSPTGEGTLQLDYRAITATLTKAIQEQQAQIEQLKQRITQLENK